MIAIVAAVMIALIVFSAVYWLGEGVVDRIERGEDIAAKVDATR